MKLTAKSAAALVLPDGKRDIFFWDEDLPGFGVRLRDDARRWVIQYRIGARQRRESLWRPPQDYPRRRPPDRSSAICPG